jgi:hypothetical protein
MKIFPRGLAVVLSVAWALTGCQSPKVARASSGGNTAQATRNNCSSLLNQLLDEEKKVSLILLIKREQDNVEKLVKKITANSAAGAKMLEEFARHDPSIRLDDFRLPPGEAATREAIVATKRKELLGQTGAAFKLSLLLSQAQALSYAWHLAKVAGENESQLTHARALAGLREDMEKRYHEVVWLLLSRTS